MASIYPRGPKLWARVKDSKGKWVAKPTPYSVGNEEKAKRFAAELQRLHDAQRVPANPHAPMTVEAFGRAWIKSRRSLAMASATSDESRLENHVYPVIGSRLLTDVRRADVRNLMLDLRREGKLAPRTIIHVWNAMLGLFHEAAVGGSSVPNNRGTARPSGSARR